MPSALEADRPQFRLVHCEACHEPRKVRQIVYGLPDNDLLEAARVGTVLLGGCMVTDDDPKWACRNCGETVR